MIDVSVIVPVWNAAATLERCLDALLAQDVPASSFEVIVVDNNSTDASATLARRYALAASASAGPVVRSLTEPRQSAYAARNRGIGAASGRLLAFTDPDCVARPDWLRRLTEAMIDPSATVISGRDRPAGPGRAVRLLGEYDHVKEACVMEGADASVYYAHTNNLMTRREVFDRTGLFDESARGGDVIFVQRVLALDGTAAVRYEPRALVDHLEIASARVYLRKARLYGRSARRYVQVVRARPLRNRERLHIFRETARRSGLSLVDSCQLFVLLGVGVGFYHLGWFARSGLDAKVPATPELQT